MPELVARYADGTSLRELASAYGVAVGTVRSRLAEAGILLRRRGAPAKPVDVARLTAHLRSGRSLRASAAACGVPRSTASRRLTSRTG